jgi:hypothetical protein
MKTRIWSLFLSLSFLANGSSAFAESSRVQETLDQSAQRLAEQIHQKKLQVADAEEALNELKIQLALAREKKDSNSSISIKTIFIVTAFVSLGAIISGIARMESGSWFLPQLPESEFFYGTLGLIASGVGYMVTDTIQINSATDKKLSSELDQAQLELSALKRSLARLEAKAKK